MTKETISFLPFYWGGWDP